MYDSQIISYLQLNKYYVLHQVSASVVNKRIKFSASDKWRVALDISQLWLDEAK